jgi:hypothetical protein
MRQCAVSHRSQPEPLRNPPMPNDHLQRIGKQLHQIDKGRIVRPRQNGTENRSDA